MSGKTWVYSDPHYYHNNIVKFENFDGTPVRPWDDATVMTDEMIEWYNELVDEGDRVYILGDVAFSATHMRNSVSRLKGRKALVKGNHDPNNHRGMYQELFDDIRGYVIMKGVVMSHIPIHPHCMGRWQLNIHGHLHNNTIKVKENWATEDDRYYNACVERTNFRPKLLDEILHERGLK